MIPGSKDAHFINVDYSYGPSPVDQATTNENIKFSHIRNVVVDRNYIYLINGNSDQNIRIKRWKYIHP